MSLVLFPCFLVPPKSSVRVERGMVSQEVKDGESVGLSKDEKLRILLGPGEGF